MATVRTQASVSLDGFITGPAGGGFEQLFEWCGNGDVEVPAAGRSYRVSEASAEYVRDLVGGYGAIVVGRGQFDAMGGWGGRHPMGVPMFVVTHEAPAGWANFTFVTEGGVARAITLAKAVAGGKTVGVGPGSVVAQALDAGLVDEIRIDLVPVLLGGGTRFIDSLGKVPVRLDDPEVIQGRGVTHLIYQVRAADPVDLVARALDQVGTLVERIRPEQATLPTPCASWDVRELVNHVVDEVQRFAESTATGKRGLSDGDVIGDNWAGGGEVPASWSIGQHVTELAVHAWDIAAATGQSTDLDPEVGVVALEFEAAHVVPEIRGAESAGFQIGPEVPIDADASLYDRIAAFCGRRWPR